MSGLFGLVDPHGPDISVLARAATSSAYRGEPEIRTWGPVALGAYVRPGRPNPFLASERTLLVADLAAAVVPAPSVPTAGSAAGAPLEALEAVLDRPRPDGLDVLAGGFAFARVDRTTGEVLLACDAFALRSLYWARDGDRLAFASDPEVLVHLGMASGELDRVSVVAYLSARDLPPWRSPFEGVRRLPGGRWVCLPSGGEVRWGRWFRPEHVEQEPMSLAEAAAGARSAILDAVRTAATGRVGLVLSGGRDSGSIAVALAELGVRADCFTFVVEEGLGTPEAELARGLALRLGHRWHEVPVERAPGPEALARVPELKGPFGPPVFTYPLALIDALERLGVDSVLDGAGGEPLFESSPIVALDLARRGRIWRAARVARAYRHDWVYPYPAQAKTWAKAITPRALLRIRERLRRAPDWIVGVEPPEITPGHAPRSCREYLLWALVTAGHSDLGEDSTRFVERMGAVFHSPLLDLRVVRLALALPDELRAPVPTPKPVLVRAFLGSAERTKGRYADYVEALAAAVPNALPGLLGPDTLAARAGYVRGALLGNATSARWPSEVLRLAMLESWLRREEKRTDGPGPS